MIAKKVKLSKVGDRYYILPQDGINKMFAMNSSCKNVWDFLQEDLTIDELIVKMAKHYDINSNSIASDIKEVVQSFIDNELIDFTNENHL